MLVSSIARFNAVQSMNNAALGIMQSYSKINSAVSNNAFGGDNKFSTLNEMDKTLSHDLASNKLLYKLALLQEQIAGHAQSKSVENSFSIFA